MLSLTTLLRSRYSGAVRCKKLVELTISYNASVHHRSDLQQIFIRPLTGKCFWLINRSALLWVLRIGCTVQDQKLSYFGRHRSSVGKSTKAFRCLSILNSKWLNQMLSLHFASLRLPEREMSVTMK